MRGMKQDTGRTSVINKPEQSRKQKTKITGTGKFRNTEKERDTIMKNTKMKKYLAVMAAVLCTGGVIAGGTLAYMTEYDEVTNVFTIGDLDIGLEEPEWNPDDGDGENTYPGYTVYKNPTVKNITTDANGEEPCYVRVIVEVQDKNGRAVTDTEALKLIEQTIRYDKNFTGTYDKNGESFGLTEGRIPGYSLSDMNSYPMVNPDFVKDANRSTANRWVFNYVAGDGILKIGEEATLFTTICIPTEWNQTQMQTIGGGIGGMYQLKISAEAIQANGFESQAAAYQALDSEIAGGTLQQIERK
ncbi:hypothetical protein BRYFOR_05472 [Marvinbryantia formatexigens DSM 14469]|uniref:SipW-cognate class signal peptide n=2 Tax=Marvinbryantia TaxID=248744 RepID=C6LA30_9FIRM|nr:hypothetical protein BRYFOR_05472 [Marvinbryantia formatexigens DSM 14469]